MTVASASTVTNVSYQLFQSSSMHCLYLEERAPITEKMYATKMQCYVSTRAF
jgi:hypothetical protein